MCGDFNCPSVNCQNVDNALLPSKVDDGTSRVIVTFCFMELAQFNNISNKNRKILDLVFCTNFGIKHMIRIESPFVIEDEHHPAFEFLFDVGVTQHLSDLTSFFKFNIKKAKYHCNSSKISIINFNLAPMK